MSKKKSLQSKKASLQSTPIFVQGLSSASAEMNSILATMEKLLHWAAIIDSSDDAIISKSVDGYITSWNRGAQKLYGYTPEEIIGKPVSVLMPPEKGDDFPFIMNQLLAGKKVEHYETKRKTKDGRVIDVSITVSPIKDSHGTIIGASKIARDISDRIENEKRREEFISIASHELKTPLTSQLAFGALLERLIIKNGHTQYQRYIQKINAQTKKFEKLINDLLDLSRIQTGNLNLDIEQFSIDALIVEIVDDIQKVTTHKIEVDSTTGTEISGDKDRIGQVLMNLLTNAIKYSPKSDTVYVSSKVEGETIVVSVRDTGIGIEKQYHQKIFERFYRVYGVDEKTYPGMGIGLDFSHEVIARHNGKIWVDSQKDKGSTFSFSLPLEHTPSQTK